MKMPWQLLDSAGQVIQVATINATYNSSFNLAPSFTGNGVQTITATGSCTGTATTGPATGGGVTPTTAGNLAYSGATAPAYEYSLERREATAGFYRVGVG